MISVPHPFAIEQASEWITQRTSPSSSRLVFAVCRRCDERLVGSFSLVAIDAEHAIGELSFWVGRPYWGQGLASEAGAAVIDEAFSTYRLNRLQAYHMVRNPASAHVLRHWGFRPEGLLRQRVRKWGLFEDVVICGLLSDEWLARKGNQTQPAAGSSAP
jgi:RimJ/RimL family protein N-acetyltransferase